MNRVLAGTIVAFMIGGCAPVGQRAVISGSAIGETLAEVKKQTTAYLGYQAYMREHPKQDPALQGPDGKALSFVCGEGKADFNIRSIRMELTTENTEGMRAGVGPIVALVPGAIAPIASVSSGRTETQKLSYNWYPVRDQKIFPLSELSEDLPIAVTLANLRAQVLDASSKPGACFYAYDPNDPDRDPGHSYIIGLNISKEGQAGVKIGVAEVALDASGTYRSVTGNTLYVTFEDAAVPRKANPNAPKQTPAQQMIQQREIQEMLSPLSDTGL